jgi:hypothetical protein
MPPSSKKLSNDMHLDVETQPALVEKKVISRSKSQVKKKSATGSGGVKAPSGKDEDTETDDEPLISIFKLKPHSENTAVEPEDKQVENTAVEPEDKQVENTAVEPEDKQVVFEDTAVKPEDKQVVFADSSSDSDDPDSVPRKRRRVKSSPPPSSSVTPHVQLVSAWLPAGLDQSTGDM